MSSVEIRRPERKSASMNSCSTTGAHPAHMSGASDTLWRTRDCPLNRFRSASSKFRRFSGTVSRRFPSSNTAMRCSPKVGISPNTSIEPIPELRRCFRARRKMRWCASMRRGSPAEVQRKMFRIYIKDVHDAARPEDRGYFRQSREAMLRGTDARGVHQRPRLIAARAARLAAPAASSTYRALRFSAAIRRITRTTSC